MQYSCPLTQKWDETNNDPHDQAPNGECVEWAIHKIVVGRVLCVKIDSQKQEHHTADEREAIDKKQNVFGKISHFVGHDWIIHFWEDFCLLFPWLPPQQFVHKSQLNPKTKGLVNEDRSFKLDSVSNWCLLFKIQEWERHEILACQRAMFSDSLASC